MSAINSASCASFAANERRLAPKSDCSPSAVVAVVVVIDDAADADDEEDTGAEVDVEDDDDDDDADADDDGVVDVRRDDDFVRASVSGGSSNRRDKPASRRERIDMSFMSSSSAKLEAGSGAAGDASTTGLESVSPI